MYSINKKVALRSSDIIKVMLFLSLLLVSSASNSAPAKSFGKDTLILEKEGLRLHRQYVFSRSQWCNSDPKTTYNEIAVFYNAPHLKRLELMGPSYTDFVNNVVIPAIVNYCDGSVDAKNINIILLMYKMVSKHPKEVIEPSNPLWDSMMFISRPSGITYAKYDPREARRHLSQDQIRALTPASELKAIEAGMQARRAETARALAEADAARKANNGYNSCKYGCITLCNKSDKTYTIATAHMQSSSTRGNRSGIDRVEIEGWWELKSGQCYQPQTALYWQTYYSIAHKSSSGKWIYPQWNVNQAVLDGSKGKGMSGYRNGSFCIKKSDHFRRHIPGRIKSAFKEVCPKGYRKAPVNLFTEGRADYDFTYRLK